MAPSKHRALGNRTLNVCICSHQAAKSDKQSPYPAKAGPSQASWTSRPLASTPVLFALNPGRMLAPTASASSLRSLSAAPRAAARSDNAICIVWQCGRRTTSGRRRRDRLPRMFTPAPPPGARENPGPEGRSGRWRPLASYIPFLDCLGVAIPLPA
jgi:hypothetical protein